MFTKSGFLFLAIFCFSLLAAGQDNPTGTYRINTIRDKNAEHPVGQEGEIRVKRISPSKIAVAVFVVTWPYGSYGDFVDTVTLKGNKAFHYNKEYDSTCRITFSFNGSRLTVEQEAATPAFPCGFGHHSDISGVYRRVSTKVPVLRDLTKEED